MPTYSYKCPDCGTAFDIHQEFTDNSLTVCPNCGSEKLRKIFSAVGVTFNGSGFYRNDSRSTKSSSEAPGKKSSTDSSSSSSSSSSDSKPAASSPSTPAAPPSKAAG